MARIYATTTDLPEALRDDPNAEDLIRRASNLVTNAIANAVFPTDAYGMPVGDDLEAARDAVVIHVSTWLSTGVNPVTGYAGKGRTVTSKGSNGTTVAYAADVAAEAHLNMLAEGTRLSPSALVPLEAQGLLDTVLVGQGVAGRLYAREYQPRRYDSFLPEGLADVADGFVGFTRAEGVVRLDFNLRTPAGSTAPTAVRVEEVPDYLWPEGTIAQSVDGALVTFSAGVLTITGIDGEYAEGMLLWGASRG
ncbi:head-to-tail adaptor [Microbacterium phage Gingerbug]|nr:head-to-tail adaptor [Microbacterium phage Gingerbug]